jgi:hypothetical protein
VIWFEGFIVRIVVHPKNLLIDVKTSSGKTAFNLVKGCKTKDHPDGNAASAWERLKK